MTRHLFETDGWTIFGLLILLSFSLGAVLWWRGVPRQTCVKTVHLAAGVYYLLLLVVLQFTETNWRYSDGILPYLLPVPPMILAVWWLLRRRART